MQLPFRTHPEGVNLNLSTLVPNPRALIKSAEDARALLRKTESRLAVRGIPKHERADLLIRRACLYEMLGDPKMLEAAQEAYGFTKVSLAAYALALAHHFHGNISEALELYERAHNTPHSFEQSFEIDYAYAVSLLYQNRRADAWKIFRKIKKRMVVSLNHLAGGRLPEWQGESCPEVSLIQEGGYGDMIHYSRYLPDFAARGVKKVVIYFGPKCHGTKFPDLLRRQGFEVAFGNAAEIPLHIPAIGFLDLPFFFPAPAPLKPEKWRADPVLTEKYQLRRSGKPLFGLCYYAEERENLFAAKGAYRCLSEEQRDRIIGETSKYVTWVNPQYGVEVPGILNPQITNWEETAAVIAQLDAVVTVDAGQMHLAAAMGKPTWVLLSGAADPKFGLAGETCGWYPSMRLFRNQGFGFEAAVDSMIQTLQAMVEK